MKTKIIFLDIDGVLCTPRATIVEKKNDFLDPIAIKLINAICEKTNAKVVISSTWRKIDLCLDRTLTYKGLDCKNFFYDPSSPFKLYGFLTPIHASGFRGDEIQEWVDYYKPEKYVIIDDDRDFHPYQKIYHIHTDTYNGLKLEDYRLAIRLLNNKMDD